MTDPERAIMHQHIGYLTDLMTQGKVLVFGPVMDPAGPYGIAIAITESDEEVRHIAANDPASSIHRYEINLMRAILPD